jgi:hypothetical protein
LKGFNPILSLSFWYLSNQISLIYYSVKIFNQFVSHFLISGWLILKKSKKYFLNISSTLKLNLFDPVSPAYKFMNSIIVILFNS